MHCFDFIMIIITKTTLWQAGVGIGIQIPTPPLHVGMTPSNQHHESCHENLWRISVHNLVTSLQLQLQISNTRFWRISYLWFKDILLWYTSTFASDVALKWEFFPSLRVILECLKSTYRVFESTKWVVRLVGSMWRARKLSSGISPSGPRQLPRPATYLIFDNIFTPPSKISDIWQYLYPAQQHPWYLAIFGHRKPQKLNLHMCVKLRQNS